MKSAIRIHVALWEVMRSIQYDSCWDGVLALSLSRKSDDAAGREGDENEGVDSAVGY